MMTEVRIIQADALVVGPDEHLIIHLRGDAALASEELMADMLEHFKGMGIEQRVFIVAGEEISFAKVAKDPE